MKRIFILTGLGLVLISGTGLLLAHLQSLQRLGTPGVTVKAEPTMAASGGIASSNTAFLPPAVEGWQGVQVPISQIALDWLPDDTIFGQRLYKATNGFEALMNIVLMGRDRTSLHKPQDRLTGAGWEITEQREDRVRILEPHAYDLPVMRLVSSRTLTLTNGVEVPVKGIFVYWFVSDDQITAQHGERMWWMARDLMFKGVLQRWAYVSCFAVCYEGTEEQTFVRMSELIAGVVPRFQAATKAPTELAQLP